MPKQSSPSTGEHPQTGPLTPEGKERSSQNALTHGCRSAKHRILPGENEDEYRALYRRWFAEYQTTSDIDVAMIQRVVNSEWRMLRCERQLVETENHIGAKPLWDWTPEDEKLMLLARRYHREAQRLYAAARKDLDSMRLTRSREMCGLVQAAKALGKLPVHNALDPELTRQNSVRPAGFNLDTANPPLRKFGLADPLDENSGPAPHPLQTA